MVAILRSLSARFYVALSATVVALVVAFLPRKYWMPPGSTVSFNSLLLLVLLVLLVPPVLALFYWLFGLAARAPQWQRQNISFPQPPAITLPPGDQLSWAMGKASNAGTLGDFIRQHNLPKFSYS